MRDRRGDRQGGGHPHGRQIQRRQVLGRLGAAAVGSAVAAGTAAAKRRQTEPAAGGGALEPTWTRRYDDRYEFDVTGAVPDGVGGFLLFGTTTAPDGGEQKLKLLAVDDTGRERWATIPPTPGRFLAFDGVRAGDAGYVLGGADWSSDPVERSVLAIDREGGVRWQTTYGQGGVAAVLGRREGAYRLLSVGDGRVRIDAVADGERRSTTDGPSYGGSFSPTGYAAGPDGDALIATRWSDGDEISPGLLRVAPDGSERWHRRYETAARPWDVTLAHAGSGGALLTYYTSEDGRTPHALRVGAVGRERWRWRHDGEGDVPVREVGRIGPGSFLLGGAADRGAWLARVTDAAEGAVRVDQVEDGAQAVTAVVPAGDGGALVATRAEHDADFDAGVRRLSEENEPVTGALDHEPRAPAPGDEVTLTADLRDPDGYVERIRWDFDGDGGFETTGETATVTFEEPGRHEVVAAAVDGAGRTREFTTTVVASTPTPEPTPSPTPTATPTTETAESTTAEAAGGTTAETAAAETGSTTESVPGFGVLAAVGGTIAAGVAGRRLGGGDE